jgi:parallel beta-helix repeat protein
MFNEVTDNYIHHCGYFNEYVAGVFLGVGDGNLIAHNRIEYVPHIAICLGVNDYGRNVLGYDEIHYASLETSDTGAINMWMDDEKTDQRQGHVIRFNLITDIQGCSVTEDRQVISPAGSANGIYLDNASNCLLYGNIIARASGAGIFVHGGANNLVENNILVDSGRHATGCLGWVPWWPNGVRSLLESRSPYG